MPLGDSAEVIRLRRELEESRTEVLNLTTTSKRLQNELEFSRRAAFNASSRRLIISTSDATWPEFWGLLPPGAPVPPPVFLPISSIRNDRSATIAV